MHGAALDQDPPTCSRLGCKRPAAGDVPFCGRHWAKAPVATAADLLATAALVRCAAEDRRFRQDPGLQAEVALGVRHCRHLETRIAEALEARGA